MPICYINLNYRNENENISSPLWFSYNSLHLEMHIIANNLFICPKHHYKIKNRVSSSVWFFCVLQTGKSILKGFSICVAYEVRKYPFSSFDSGSCTWLYSNSMENVVEARFEKENSLSTVYGTFETGQMIWDSFEWYAAKQVENCCHFDSYKNLKRKEGFYMKMLDI